MLANYHTHTRWCNHATGEAEDYIRKAIQLGLKEVAITDHIPHPDNSDPYRMRWEDFNEFNILLDQAIDKYKDRIRIYKGFEAEYYPDEMELYRNFKEKYGYTFMILGQHRCGPHREQSSFRITTPQQIELYTQTVCEALETGFFVLFAHPDLFMYSYPQWDQYTEKAMRTIFSTCQRLNIPVEINGKGYARRSPYPCLEAWKCAKDYPDLKILINADAHSPEEIYNDSTRELEQKVRELGLTVTEIL